MLKNYTLKPFIYSSLYFILIFSLAGCKNNISKDNHETDLYDGPEKAAEQDYMMTYDRSTGKIPRQELIKAIEITRQSKNASMTSPTNIDALSWAERGPNYDLTGPSNGNTRANNDYTSGRIRAIFADQADATHKTVWVGGVDGGLWKTTDITLSPATWVLVNDYLSNLAVTDICQDPSDATGNTMYFCTGEPYYNGDAVNGNGVFRSTDHGVTWSQLASTSNYTTCTKMLCDATGNIYLATRGNGLLRSTKASGGAVWTNIAPTGFVDIGDMKLSSTGRLHITTGIFSSQVYRYTDAPLTVASGTWTAPTTAFPSYNARAEIAVSGNTLYALPSNTSYTVPTIYKSTDGGATWAATAGQQATATFSNGQAWYALAIDIDPSNANNCIVGGLDTWKTSDGGASWQQISTWVGTSPVAQYVHADVHKVLWFDNGNKLLFGCDGGIHYSSDKGTTIRDRNRGLRIKQFYSCAAHPTTTNYFLAGAQDNGTHQLTNAGLGSSTEVTGGDGAFVAIDQDQPQYQFGAYVYNQYRRSTDGGNTWSSVNFSNNTGQFINPFDYDNTNNKMYCGYTAGQYLRWDDPQTGSTFTGISIPSLASGAVTTVSVSPYTSNQVYFGTDGGRIVKVTNANLAVPTDVNITGTVSASSGNPISSIMTGTDDNNLIITISAYGASLKKVWVTSNGGTTWTAIDGNLPNMPIRWAVFYPGDNSKAYIATETGVWETSLINGASTVWSANTTFPSVRTDMLRYRSGDRTLVAATHGRGLWTATIPNVTTPDIQFQVPLDAQTETTVGTSGCRGYKDYTYNMIILNPPTGNATVTLGLAAGATATQNVDYAFTTNGNFVSPSNTLTFPSGATTPQPFTVRIYDDAAVESTESFTLNYTISGATNAQAGTSNQTFTLSIYDNDAAPITPFTSTQQIGTSAYNLGGALFNSSLISKRCQMLYLASELTTAGFSAGNLTGISFYIGVKNSTRPFTNLTLKMGGTTLGHLVSGGYNAITVSTVKNPFTYSTVAGFNDFVFDVPFVWNGTDNVAVELCYDNGTADATQTTDATYGYSDCGGSCSGLGNMFWQDGINCATAFGSVSYYSNDIKPRIKLVENVTGTAISTALNSTKNAYLGPNDDVYFYDASGNIMARIKNLTSFDYGCTQLTIDRAGTGSVQFWNNNTANYLMSKSIKVVPTNNTTTGHYQITVYNTSAEVSGWQTATGQTYASAQVVKVSNGFYIPDVTPATPHTSDVSYVSGTAVAFGTNNTMMGDFSSTGFSGFGIGIPASPLPITLTYFNGYVNGNYGMLEWKTSSEYNNKGFDLERSYDGLNFNKIVFVPGAGNSSVTLNYSYNDRTKLTDIQYYRLKQIDLNGRFVYSNTVILKSNNKDKLDLLSITNPFVNSVTMLFSKPPVGPLNMTLYDMNGRIVYTTSKITGGLSIMDFNIPVILSSGNYILKVNSFDQQFVKKLVKQ